VTPFADIIGHAAVLELLSAELTTPAQAYLFVGPANVGKATVARRFAAALICDGDARCFRRAVAGTHPDVALIEPEGRTAITVDQARAVVTAATRSPLEAARRVFLFEEAGMLNDEAANALLKTLEEPTPKTSFVLVAESVDELPETVASRCRTIVFGRVDEAALAAGLERLGAASAQRAGEVAVISGGRPGLALSLATRPEAASFRQFWLSVPLRLPEHPGGAFRLADEAEASLEPVLAALGERQEAERELAGDGGGRILKDRQVRELKRVTDAMHVAGLEILAGFYRDAAVAQHGVPARNRDIPVAALTRLAPVRAVANADRVLATITALEANQRPRLALANLFSDLATDG